MHVHPESRFPLRPADPPSTPAEQRKLLKDLGIEPAEKKAQTLLAQHGHTLFLTFKGSRAPLALVNQGACGMEVHKAARGKGQKVDHPLPQGFGELALALADAAPAQALPVLTLALDCPAPPATWTAVDEAFVIAREACHPTTPTTTTTTTTATTTTTTISVTPVTATTTTASTVATAPLTPYTLSDQRAAMVKAIEADQPKDVLAMLMRAPLLDADVLEGTTPLRLAARLGKLKVLDYLLSHPGIEPDQVGPQGKTALHEAATHGQLAAVERLLRDPRVNTRLPLPSDNTTDAPTPGATPFYLAIEHGRLDVAQRLLTHDKTLGVKPGLVLNRPVTNGATPLHAACTHGNLACVQWLWGLDGHQVQRQDHQGHTPLMYAVRSGHLHIAEWLMAKKADIHQRAKDGSTLLHVACAGGQLEALQWVLELADTSPQATTKTDAPHPWNLPTQKLETPLSLAVKSGRAGVAQRLLKQEGIAPNLVDGMGHTPLYNAVRNLDIDMVKALLEHPGTDADHACEEEKTPFLLAVEIGQLDMVKLLFPRTQLHLSKHKGDTAVYAACKNLKLDVVEWLLKQPNTRIQKGKKIRVRAVLNQVRHDGATPLTIAIQDKNGSLELVKFLLTQRGIDVNLRSDDGTSPLERAIVMGLPKIVDQLLSRPEIKVFPQMLELALTHGRQPIADLLCRSWKMDIHHVDNEGRNALHLACQSGDLPTVEWVVKRLATSRPDGQVAITPTVLNARDHTGFTPLHVAASRGNPEVVQKLLAMPGIDPNLTTKALGLTPLHVAAYYPQGDGTVVGLLLKAPRMAIDQRDDTGATALHMAARNGAWDEAERLLNAGADIHLPNDENLTPLQLACRAGAQKTVRLLLGRPEIRRLNGQSIDPVAVLNQTTPDGKTLLHLAIEDDRMEMVAFLLGQKGIDPNKADGDGLSPLHIAVQRGHIDIVNALLAHPAIDVGKKDRYGHNMLSCIREIDTAGAMVKAVQDSVKPREFRALAEARNRWGAQAASVLAQHGIEADVIRLLPVTPVKKPLKLPTTTYQKGWIIAGGEQPDWNNHPLVRVGTEGGIQMETCGDGRVDLSWKALNDLPVQPGDVVICQFKIIRGLGDTPMAVLGKDEVAPFVEVARLMFGKGAMRVLLMCSDLTQELFSEDLLKPQLLKRFRNDPSLPRAADPKSAYQGLDYTLIFSDPHLNGLNASAACYWLVDCKIQREKPGSARRTHMRSVLPMTTLAWDSEQATLTTSSRDALGLNGLPPLSDKGLAMVLNDLMFGCLAVSKWTGRPDLQAHAKLLELLGTSLVSPNAQDILGRRVLNVACLRGWMEFAIPLVAAGANPHLADANGQTSMALACAHGHGHMVEWLLSIGLRADEPTPTGHPLLIAIEKGHAHVVQHLLDAGARPETKDSQGRTALELAKSLQNPTIVQMLQRRLAPGTATTTTTDTTTTQADSGTTTPDRTAPLKN